MMIAKVGALSVCPFVVSLDKVGSGHSCPFLSDSVMEVSRAHVTLALDARCLFVLLSESANGEKVIGSSSRRALGRTRATGTMWE